MIIRIIITILGCCFLGWLLCDIDPNKYYTWYSGIWHGLFFVANFIRSIFFDAEFKATEYSVSYNVFYGIFAIATLAPAMNSTINSTINSILAISALAIRFIRSILAALFGGKRRG